MGVPVESRAVGRVVTDAVHVDMLDHGGPGVYATPSRVSAEGADLSVLVRARNDQAAPTRVAVRSRLLDAAGRTVATLSDSVEIAPGAVMPVTPRISAKILAVHGVRP
jgi:beta-galactosidase